MSWTAAWSQARVTATPCNVRTRKEAAAAGAQHRAPEGEIQLTLPQHTTPSPRPYCTSSGWRTAAQLEQRGGYRTPDAAPPLTAPPSSPEGGGALSTSAGPLRGAIISPRVSHHPRLPVTADMAADCPPQPAGVEWQAWEGTLQQLRPAGGSPSCAAAALFRGMHVHMWMCQHAGRRDFSKSASSFCFVHLAHACLVAV